MYHIKTRNAKLKQDIQHEANRFHMISGEHNMNFTPVLSKPAIRSNAIGIRSGIRN